MALERRHNPFIRSFQGGRILSATMLPWFLAAPPVGFGVLTTTGRRTGKRRRRCVRAIRQDDRVYLVSIGGRGAAWVKNIRSDPAIRLRLGGGAVTGAAREIEDPAELERARAAFCETVNRFDYVECSLHRSGRPSRAKIQELHRRWFERGTALVVELQSSR